MIRKFLLPALALAFCFGALTAPAAADRMRISRADCQKLVQYRPDPGVAYKPGVDVHGNPVAPADLPGSASRVPIPKQVEFDISFNPLKGAMRRRFNQTELHVGTVRYDLGTGEVTFNGVPLTNAQKDEVAYRCRQALHRR
jgi:hypothetical protein